MRKQSPTTKGATSNDVSAMFYDSLGEQWHITVNIKTKRGRAEIHSLTIESVGDLPINRRVLSEIPLDELFKSTLASEEQQRTIRKKRIEPHNGRRYTDDELKTVADVYLTAYKQRISVQRAVADSLGVGLPTAAKRIIAARDRGFIPAEINARKAQVK